MKIEKIIKLKDGKYKVIIDSEEIIMHEEVILENKLLYKKYIDQHIYNNIIEQTKYYMFYNKALKYCLKKRRSENQTKQYLIKLDLNTKDIEKIIDKLKLTNILNDREYCRAYINDKIYLSKNGINKIRIDLLNEGILPQLIEQELNNIDFSLLNNKLERLIKKKIKLNTKYSNYVLKSKILIEMLNLGYDKEEIVKLIDDNLVENNNILEKEFNKIYNNLSRKYSGEETYEKLKQKLLYKGFKISDINDLIRKKQK